jgi:hypothetical protein
VKPINGRTEKRVRRRDWTLHLPVVAKGSIPPVLQTVSHRLQKLSRLNSPSRANCAYGKNARLNRHLTRRLLIEREGYPVNQRAVIDACAQTGTWIELNANPYRFDMDWRLWAYAKSKGVSGRDGKGMTGKGMVEEALKSYAIANNAIAKSGKVARA